MPQVVAYLESSVSGLDPLTGSELWRYSWGEQYGPHGTWPLYQEPFLFYALPFRCGGHALKLSPTKVGVRVTVAWTNSALSMDMLSGVIVDGFIYGFDVRDFQTTTNRPTRGLFKCVELATGRERWASPLPGHASVLACGHRLLLLNERGVLIAAEASPTAYQELARAPIFPRQPCWTSPALCGELLVARSHREFVCLDLGDPARRMVSASSGNLTAPARRSRAEGWFARHQSQVFYMPGWRIQWRWFLASLLGVFAPAILVAAVVSKDIPRRRVAFYLSGLLLSLWGTWGLTEALGWFVFTWPTGVFLSLMLALEVRAWAVQRRERLARAVARIALSRAGRRAGGILVALPEPVPGRRPGLSHRPAAGDTLGSVDRGAGAAQRDPLRFPWTGIAGVYRLLLDLRSSPLVENPIDPAALAPSAFELTPENLPA